MVTKNCLMKSIGVFISFQKPSSSMSTTYTFMPQKTMKVRLLKFQDQPICSATITSWSTVLLKPPKPTIWMFISTLNYCLPKYESTWTTPLLISSMIFFLEHLLFREFIQDDLRNLNFSIYQNQLIPCKNVGCCFGTVLAIEDLLWNYYILCYVLGLRS